MEEFLSNPMNLWIMGYIFAAFLGFFYIKNEWMKKLLVACIAGFGTLFGGALTAVMIISGPTHILMMLSPFALIIGLVAMHGVWKMNTRKSP